MKNGFIKKLALFMSAVMVAGSLAACGNNAAETTGGGTEGTNTESSVPESESVSEPEATGGANTLVAGYDFFSSKFSPFFHKIVVDERATLMTQVLLLDVDREGNIVQKAIEGETRAYYGTDYFYDGIADCDIIMNDDGTVYYDFTIRDDIVFSDGTPMTIDDVIFSLYVICDPTYEGGLTFYALPVTGMEDYRSGMESVASLILAAGPDNTDFTYFTEAQQTAYWEAVERAGASFAQDIVDYCVTNYSDYLPDVADSEVALGMYVWGFGEPSEDLTTITGAGTGTEYDIASVTTADYWAEIYADYDGDIQDASDTEVANIDLFTFVDEELGNAAADYVVGVNTGSSVDSIEGIVKTGDYSMRVIMDKYDATAIYQFNMAVAPMHYYGSVDLYDYDNNSFGFVKGDLSSVRAKTTQPLGAGAYVFESFQNGVITYTANANYYRGEPKISTVLFKETQEADKLSGIVSGAFDITDPSMSVSVLDSIKEYNSNGEIIGDVITTSLVDYLGYGYFGISADNVKVGNKKDSDESKNLRKAFATVIAAYRDTVINSYYGEMAAVIQYPISNTSWAAPRPADEGYAIAYSKDVEGNSIYTSGMSDEDKYVAALEAAVGFFKAAGYTYDESSGTFTAAPAGASMTYELIVPGGGTGSHPAFGIITAAKEALAGIGITLEINDPADSNVLWTKTESGTAEMWTMAWQATPDPDMYQVYHSSNVVGGGGTESNQYGIQDSRLDELIISARESADQSYRKATYKEALEIILDWGVEIPDYQRQDAYIYSTERVNISTMTPDITTYWDWTYGIETMEMN